MRLLKEENDMKSQGYGMLLTSTQVDEEARFFIDVLGYEQPMEMF